MNRLFSGSLMLAGAVALAVLFEIGQRDAEESPWNHARLIYSPPLEMRSSLPKPIANQMMTDRDVAEIKQCRERSPDQIARR